MSLAGAFFGGDGVIGKIFLETADDQSLGAAVGLGDQVEIAFVGNRRRTLHFFAQDFAGVLRDFDSYFEKEFSSLRSRSPGGITEGQ